MTRLIVCGLKIARCSEKYAIKYHYTHLLQNNAKCF